MIDIVCLPIKQDEKTFIKFSHNTIPYCAVFFDGYDQGVVYNMQATKKELLILRETGRLVPVTMKDELMNILTKGGKLENN